MLESRKKIFFASDVHLGAPSINNSREHERMFVSWLDAIKDEAREIYLMGDIFDFWFEYKHVVPRGFTRFLGKVCEITDSGIPVHFFTGNHDIWVFDYLPSETGVIVHREPCRIKLDGKFFFLAHGDGLAPDEKAYKRLKRLFTSTVAQKMFSWLHPDLGVQMARFWSRKSRSKNEQLSTSAFQGEEKEWLIKFAKKTNNKQFSDYFVFGHRHIALDKAIGKGSRVIYLGDWVSHFSYGEWDGDTFELKFFNSKKSI